MTETRVVDFSDQKVTLYCGDSREVIKTLAPNSIDSCVCDPPYALVSIAKRFGADGAAPAKAGVYARGAAGFMGKKWDTGEVAFDPEFWGDVLRVLKPGAHVLAFGGTRTYHRLACAIEDAGFEIRDQIAWLYGSGFPKSHDIAKAIDKHLGATGDHVAIGASVKRMIPGADQNKAGWEKNNGREYQPGEYVPASPNAVEWDGWGTALKPAIEPIVVARKPIEGTNAQNVLKWGVGALNIDGCRVGADGGTAKAAPAPQSKTVNAFGNGLNGGGVVQIDAGRWPANVIHDGSEEVLAAFPEAPGALAATPTREIQTNAAYGNNSRKGGGMEPREDGGSAARFFYTAKADAEDRLGSKHPTVKPVDLMQYLIRLVTPKGGTVLDPFAGTGSTGEAAWREGMKAILIEREAEYQADIERRMELALHPTKRAAVAKSKNKLQGAEGTPLFGDA